MTMQQSEIKTNPFAVKTPENLAADEIVDLFVPYPEFENLQVSGHQFLHGHRGSGKSMMLRMMSPDSQLLSRGCGFTELPYFGVYLSIKATELNSPEYVRLENELTGTILSEHVLTTKLLSTLFSTIKKNHQKFIQSKETAKEFRKIVVEDLFNRFKYAGWQRNFDDVFSKGFGNIKDVLEYVIKIIDDIHVSSAQYIRQRSFRTGHYPYQGVLLGFQDILLPVVHSLSSSTFLRGMPIYFLLDDADNLTKQQTQVLNTWVSYRTTEVLSLKISTQMNYKTYTTTSGIRIESPHDFSSINFTSVHTGSVKERYPKIIKEIVEKRLSRYHMENTNPLVFFPKDKKQEDAIKKIEEEIKAKWKPGESGYRPEDDAYRFARPEYIRRLSGVSKQGGRYRYAGFEQLVHVSSGIVRFFLEPASRMFTEQLLKNDFKPVTEISPAIQDQELRKQADQLLLQEFEKLEQEVENTIDKNGYLNDVTRLRNLIKALGALFKAHIMDETITQRRVFSFTISGGDIPKELKTILRLGVVHGYLYEDSIGTKNGLGREILYVLTRRLAPAFSLDPIGFSAHISISVDDLLNMSNQPQTYINRLKRNKKKAHQHHGQLSIFDEGQNEEDIT